VNNPLRYVDPTGEDWWNPLDWGAAIAAAGAAVGDWWTSSSIWDKLDVAMTRVESGSASRLSSILRILKRWRPPSRSVLGTRGTSNA
jgi:hypothetical protein